MTKPLNFILTSDYTTLKNDNHGTLSLYLGDSGVMNYGDIHTYSTDLTIGTINSGVRCQISTSADNVIYSSPQRQIILQQTIYISGTQVYTGNFYTTAFVERISATTMRLKCLVWNDDGGTTVRITGGYQTVTANVVTFLSPFN